MDPGTSVLNSLQLARGYTPSVIGLKSSLITQEMSNGHVELMAAGALQKLLMSRTPSRVIPSHIQTDKMFWVYYKTFKQNISIAWVSARTEKATPHYIVCYRSNRGPSMKVTYEHVRIQPIDEHVRKLAQSVFGNGLKPITITDTTVDESAGEDAHENYESDIDINPHHPISSLLSFDGPIVKI